MAIQAYELLTEQDYKRRKALYRKECMSIRYRVRSEIFLCQLVYRAEFKLGTFDTWRACESKSGYRTSISVSYKSEQEANEACEDHYSRYVKRLAEDSKLDDIPLIL